MRIQIYRGLDIERNKEYQINTTIITIQQQPLPGFEHISKNLGRYALNNAYCLKIWSSGVSRCLLTKRSFKHPKKKKSQGDTSGR
jgi:hypothetical protein